MHIMFAVKMVPLKAYAIFVIPMTLTFTQGHNCASNVTYISTCSLIVMS